MSIQNIFCFNSERQQVDQDTCGLEECRQLLRTREALHTLHVFWAAAPITAIGFFLALKLRETPLRSNQEYAAAREEAVGESLG